MLEFFEKFSAMLTPKFGVVFLTVWQFCSVLLMAIGVWPVWMVWINLLLTAVYIVCYDTYHSLLLLILSIPFFVAVPNSRFDSLQTWRILFLLLFGTQLIRVLWKEKSLKNLFKFSTWDYFLGAFLVVSAFSLFFAKFPMQGLRQILFWLNIWLIYFVLQNIVRTRKQIVEVIIAAAVSLGIVVLLGYLQLIFTFFTSLEFFWTYWASFVSKLYYGSSLAEVLLYSNSWFAYHPGSTDLRMFSILPDSHAFALLSVFCIMFLVPLTYFYHKRPKKNQKPKFVEGNISLLDENNKMFGLHMTYVLWTTIRFAALAIVLSGTRAVWAGLIVPLVLIITALVKKFLYPMSRKLFWPYLIIIVFFLLAPFINQGLQLLRVKKFQENFLDRAKTIYDLREESNIGRIEIWRRSLMTFRANPWGLGLGNFIVSVDNEKDYLTFESLAGAHNERFNLPQKYITAHNLYLHVLVETGFLGLLTFLAFWLKFFWDVENFIRKHASDNNVFIFFVFGTAVTMVWILASAMFDVTFFNDKVLMYFFIGLGLSSVIMRSYHYYRKDVDNG